MLVGKGIRALGWMIAAVAALGMAVSAHAQEKKIKIGVIYDLTGPFAGGGSKPASIGNKIAIDMVNERGGVEGHKIVGIFVDAQSKIDVAINEAERLLNEQKVDVLMGVYSSAQCVPMSAKVDAAKKFLSFGCVRTEHRLVPAYIDRIINVARCFGHGILLDPEVSILCPFQPVPQGGNCEITLKRCSASAG